MIIDIRNKKLIDPKTNISIKGSIYSGNHPTPKFYSLDSNFGKILKEFPNIVKEPDFLSNLTI